MKTLFGFITGVIWGVNLVLIGNGLYFRLDANNNVWVFVTFLTLSGILIGGRSIDHEQEN